MFNEYKNVLKTDVIFNFLFGWDGHDGGKVRQ